MLFIPFIYFLLLTAYWWIKHRALDVCVYMSGLYTLTSLFAIVIVYGNMLGEGGILFNEIGLTLGIIPTLLYCAILTLSIWPFSMLYGKDLKNVYVSMSWLPLVLGCIFIAVSFLNLYLVADSTLEILQGDLSSVRSDHYAGFLSPAEIKAQSMSAPLRYFYILNTSTLLALPLFFYSICFEHRPWWYNVLLFFASMSVPIKEMQVADRTEIVFFGMMFIYCLLFFYKFLSKKVKVIFLIMGIPVVTAALVYFVAVSQARFDEREGGAGTGAMQYAGQGYLNFCYFWENANPDIISAEREFPLIHHYIYHIDSNPERRAVRSGQQGFFISVFASFIGDLMLDLSPIGMILWVIFYSLLCFYVIQHPHREELSLGEVLAIFALAVIPVFGIFYYRYYVYKYTVMLLLVILVYLLSKVKFVYK